MNYTNLKKKIQEVCLEVCFFSIELAKQITTPTWQIQQQHSEIAKLAGMPLDRMPCWIGAGPVL